MATGRNVCKNRIADDGTTMDGGRLLSNNCQATRLHTDDEQVTKGTGARNALYLCFSVWNSHAVRTRNIKVQGSWTRMKLRTEQWKALVML